jgi:hypothetical protein
LAAATSLTFLAAVATPAPALDGGAETFSFPVEPDVSIWAGSAAYERAEVAAVVDQLGALPHGLELAKLKVYVATDAEVAKACGGGTMACYDPDAERMTVSGESEEIAGIPRVAAVAHEYGHHIANNRHGTSWSALAAGTPRWSTHEQVCQLAGEGQVFPGDQGAHYWENPGEAFAQAYSQMVQPQDAWHYSPLLQPDEAALAKLRLDVLDPPSRREMTWRHGVAGGDAGIGVGQAVAFRAGAATTARFRRPIESSIDGRIVARLRAGDGSRYSLALVDPTTGAVLARSIQRPNRGVARLDFNNCGHRQLVLEAVAHGDAGAFEAKIRLP